MAGFHRQPEDNRRDRRYDVLHRRRRPLGIQAAGDHISSVRRYRPARDIFLLLPLHVVHRLRVRWMRLRSPGLLLIRIVQGQVDTVRKRSAVGMRRRRRGRPSTCTEICLHLSRHPQVFRKMLICPHHNRNATGSGGGGHAGCGWRIHRICHELLPWSFDVLRGAVLSQLLQCPRFGMRLLGIDGIMHAR